MEILALLDYNMTHSWHVYYAVNEHIYFLMAIQRQGYSMTAHATYGNFPHGRLDGSNFVGLEVGITRSSIDDLLVNALGYGHLYPDW